MKKLFPISRYLGALAFLGLLAAAPSSAQQFTCSSSSDACAGEYSNLFAISHSYLDSDILLMRVSIDAWSTGTAWGDGTNGFFYRATAGADSWDYVPFNGFAVGQEGQPELPEDSCWHENSGISDRW